MRERYQSLVQRILAAIFPTSPDFLSMLAEQARKVTRTVNLLADFMATGAEEKALQIRQDEHDADTVKIANLHALNAAFSTPIDREDIYRSIVELDEIVNVCKDCVHEMRVLSITPDRYTYELATYMREGCAALAEGFSKLASSPEDASEEADTARKSSRHMEKLYREALASLFSGDNYLDMFKRREIYQHLDRAGEKIATCANTLHDIIVKIS